MDYQQQTETLIKEMLQFLDTSSEEEEEDEPEELTENDISKNKTYAEVLIQTQTEVTTYQKPPTTKEPKIWTLKEIAAIAEPIWRQSSLLDNLDDAAEGEELTPTTDKNDWHTKLETNCRHGSNNAYLQEVQEVIYGDTTNHPASNSADYYQAAQNYAVYGKNFLDFPENLESVLSDKSTSSANTFANQGVSAVNNGGAGGLNNFEIPNISTSNSVSTTSAAAVVGSTASYYQPYNGMQPQTRPILGYAPSYGIYLGNKVTYLAAAPTAPSVVYNQHTTSTYNFITNSLANAVLNTSPAILYAAAGNSAQGVAVGANATGIYERIFYAQMHQRKIYQAQQNAAAIFHYKQRVAAVAAASASSRLISNGVYANVASSGNTAVSPPPATSAATICNNTAAAKVCTNSNQSSSLGSNSSLEQQNSSVSPENTI